MTDPAAPHLALRAATSTKHEEVDATFARYDFADPASYGALLAAHARVLPPIEQALAGYPGLPAFPPRTSALADDLVALGRSLPQPDAVPRPASPAEAWGMLYVIEGSRLGGVFLARSVPEGLPKAYLSAGHVRGGWRAMLDALDQAAEGEAWLQQAITAATTTFDLYAAAAARTQT